MLGLKECALVSRLLGVLGDGVSTSSQVARLALNYVAETSTGLLILLLPFQASTTGHTVAYSFIYLLIFSLEVFSLGFLFCFVLNSDICL